MGDRTQIRVVATGARYKRLSLPNLAQFEGQGVHYAATAIEGRLCAGSEVVVVGGGDDIRVAGGALLEILLAIAGIATAVVIFPIVKRVNESVALGYVASRTVESILILVGVVSLMSVVGLRQDLADATDNGGALDVAGGLLVVHDQTALLGPQFCAGLGNGILLGYLMWRSRLLPRPMVMIGLIGGPLALLAGIGVLVGAWDRTSGLPVALTAPEAIWEFSLSVWLLVRGFRPSSILTGPPVVPSKTS